VPKGTVLAVVFIWVIEAPSSAVQFGDTMLFTVKDKLSATVACTVTPELMETSMLPDPPKVPPTEMV